jgi:putative phage-type endonuclease
MSETLFHESCTAIVADSDRTAWLLARRSHITATDVAAILGLSPWKDAMGVYADKVVAAPADPGDPAEHLIWGRVLEAPIADEFARRSGRQLLNGGTLLESRETPMLAVTLDREQIDPARPTPGVYEGKTVTAWLARDWKHDAPPPDHVMLQVQTQLLVTRATWATVFALIGGNSPVAIEVEANQEVQEVILAAVLDFWQLVERRQPPEVTAYSKDALAALYPKQDGTRVYLPAEAVEWTQKLHAIRADRKALEKEEEHLKNRLRSCIGPAAFGVLPADVDRKGQWKWVVEDRAERVTPAGSSRVLREVKADRSALRLREAEKPPALEGKPAVPVLPEVVGGVPSEHYEQAAPEVEAEPVEKAPPAMRRSRSRRR